MLNQVALMLQDQGKLDEAEPLMREALDASCETRGARHPETLNSMGNMGDILREKGDLEQAAQLLEEAMAAANEVFGPTHMKSLKINAMVGRLVLAQSEGKDATRLKEAVEKMKEVLGADHPQTRKYGKVLEEL